MHSPRQWSRADAAIIAALIALTALPFAQTATFDFVSLDDAAYITQSELVQRGLDPIAMVDALGFHQDNWHPVVWWSLMLDVELFGLNPGPFHVENVFWHVLNVVLLYAAMNELTGDRWRSAFIAAVFGIHPLHVESVAWVTERKDVLSGFWWMAGLWSYAVWAKTGRPRYWRFVTAALVLGLMTKQIMVTLPCVFLLLDAWPLNRWRDPSAGRWTARRLKSSVIEKLPWIGCVAVASWLAMQAQQTAAASASDWPLSLRLSNATMSLV